MTIKLKKIIPFHKYKSDNISSLDKSKTYRVIGIESPYYVLISERGTLILSPMLFFDIIDDTMDKDWVIYKVEECGDNPYDIQIRIESKKLKNFNYDKFYNYDIKSVEFYINYLNSKNIIMSSNLMYCPIKSRKEYYKKLLEKINKNNFTRSTPLVSSALAVGNISDSIANQQFFKLNTKE